MGQLEQDQARYCELMEELTRESKKFDREAKEKSIRDKAYQEINAIWDRYRNQPPHQVSAAEKEASNKGCAAGIIGAVIVILNIILAFAQSYSWVVFGISTIAVIICIIVFNKQTDIQASQKKLTEAAEKAKFDQEKKEEEDAHYKRMNQTFAELEKQETQLLKPLIDEMDAIVEKYIQSGSWDFFSIAQSEEYKDIFLYTCSWTWYAIYLDNHATTEQKEALYDGGYSSYCDMFIRGNRRDEHIITSSALKYNRIIIIPNLQCSTAKYDVIAPRVFSSADVLYLAESFYGDFAPTVKTIYYNGLRRKWNNSVKSAYSYTVHCTDGTIKL